MGAKRLNWKRRAVKMAKVAVDKYGTKEGREAQGKLIALTKIHPEAVQVPIIRKVIKTEQVTNYDVVEIKRVEFGKLVRYVFDFNGIFTAATFDFLSYGKWPHVIYKEVPPLINSVIKIGPYRFRVIGIDPHNRIVNLYSLFRLRDRVRQWFVKMVDKAIVGLHQLVYKK